MSKKLPTTFQDAKKILGSVYPDLMVHVQPKVNQLRTNLLNQNLDDKDPKEVVRSVLKPLDFEDSTKTERHPLSKSLEMLPVRRIHKLSNVLLFRSRNQLLHKSDFQKLAPKETSVFDLIKEHEFKVRRGRAKDTLQERMGYYLIFKSVQEAAAFNVDTLGKLLNGVNFYLEMVNPAKDNHYFNSPLFHETYNMDGDVVELQTEYPRENCVLFRGLPNFITKETISKMLYDYSIDYISGGITPIEIDNFAKLGSWLVKFETPLDAQRVARNYNGYHLNNNPDYPKIFATVLS